MTKTQTIEKAPAQAFNFATLDIATAGENPYEFELVHPDTKDGLGVFVSVISAESETFLRYVREESNRARREAFKKQAKGKDEPSTAEEDEERLLRALAACMKGWRTVTNGESEPAIVWGPDRLEFNEANAIRWMRQFRWVRLQINEATGELANFIAD